MSISAEFAQSLAYRLLIGPRMDPRKAATLIAEVADVLQRSHDQNGVHGALEPSNIRLDVDGHPSLPAVPPRATGSIMNYSSPEQLRLPGGPPQRTSDIYALGVILYELLTGQRAFAGGNEVIEKILAGALIPPRKLSKAIPARLEAICLKALAKDPATRYATAGELAAALREYLNPRRKPFWK
jgi:serine/threonine protein kinase